MPQARYVHNPQCIFRHLVYCLIPCRGADPQKLNGWAITYPSARQNHPSDNDNKWRALFVTQTRCVPASIIAAASSCPGSTSSQIAFLSMLRGSGSEQGCPRNSLHAYTKLLSQRPCPMDQSVLVKLMVSGGHTGSTLPCAHLNPSLRFAGRQRHFRWSIQPDQSSRTCRRLWLGSRAYALFP